jgi:DNA-binding transcriptional MerR regulator
MKDYLSIGQFSKQSGISPRALRIYEEVGLIQSHARGENGYRYYRVVQLELVARIKQFKGLGFSLSEIKSLLQVDLSMDSEKLRAFLERRRQAVLNQEADLFRQKEQIEIILTSLKKTNTGLGPSERRYIMSHFEKISVVVTGIKDLEKTAQLIECHLQQAGQKAEVLVWNSKSKMPKSKPYIIVLREDLLKSEDVKLIAPDVVVIKDLSEYTPELEKSYLNLYTAVGPHMATIFNADDRVSVALAGNETIRKGKTFYFSKNSGLESQIMKIGGVISDGEDIKIFGFNQTPGTLSIKIEKMMTFDEEVSIIASLAAIMDIGLSKTGFKLPVL